MRPVEAAETFCTIMSTLMPALGQRLEDRRRLARLVGDADDRDLGIVHVGGDAGDDRLFHGLSFCDSGGDGSGDMTMVPVRCENDERTWMGRSKRRAYSTQRRCSTLAPHGGELEHLLVGDVRHLARGGHDPRVGGEHAVDVGVDLADVGVERRGERHGGGVGAAAAERGDVLGVLGDALEAGDDQDRALVERRLDAAGRDVDDPRRAVLWSR